jgi:hypothetical protein
MTTTVKVHVGGKYRAHVAVAHTSGEQEEHTVDGDGVEGAAGELSITLRHPADATIHVSESPVEG